MGKQHQELSEEEVERAWDYYLYRTPKSELGQELQDLAGSLDFEAMSIAERASLAKAVSVNPEGPGKPAVDDRMDVNEFFDVGSDAWRKFTQTGAYEHVKSDINGFRTGVEKAINSTAVLMFRSQWEAYLTGMRFDLKTRLQGKYNSPKPYCGRYGDQVSMARGTGFLVGPDLLLTAYHNLHQGGLDFLNDLVFVFGYHLDNRGNNPSADELPVRTAKSMVDHDAKKDWALIRLSHEVGNGDTCLQFSQYPIPENGLTPLYIVGSSSGLPLKLCLCGHHVKKDNDARFRTNLDVFGGNSGSPVINLLTHRVEGILVKGAEDYECDLQPCIQPISHTYEAIAACKHGEICTSIRAVDLSKSSAQLQ
jgi:Trypsin-like peptidase domain